MTGAKESSEVVLDPNKFHLLSEDPGPDEKNVPDVDIERAFNDHDLDRALLPLIKEQLSSLSAFVVPSGSTYKARVIQKILRQLCPDKKIPIIIVQASSGISEQPVGKETVEGAKNRKDGARKMIHSIKQGASSGNAQIDELLRGTLGLIGAAENGIRQQNLANQNLPLEEETQDFDPTAQYVDVAYTIIDFDGVGETRQVSPPSEAVLFPHEDVITTFEAAGSFRENTVGKFMQARLSGDPTFDHQDPQAYLTQGRLPRSQQLATVIVKGFAELAQK